MLKGSCVYSNDNDSMFALGKPIPEQENVNVFDNLVILQILSQSKLGQWVFLMPLSLICK